MRIRSSIATVLALALAVAGQASGQEPTRITGRVVDAANQQPIVAVQVVVTGTSFGAATNDSGRFLLRAQAGARTLSFRRIGYVQTTVPIVAGQTEYEVALKRDILQLDQQLITGVATTTSSKNAATFDPVLTSSQLNGAPTSTLENALQGKLPGVLVEQNSGAPGGGLQVNVRGVTSILGNSDPLYVVDGIIVSNATFQSGLNAVTQADGATGMPSVAGQDQSVNRIADLNPNDIESIQVLEGAAAASIYGARAAGGVILITTKKGVPGKPQVDATQKFGTFNLEHELDIRHFSLANAYSQGTNVGLDSAQVLQNYNACKGFCDYQKSFYGGGQLSYETDLSVRGGSNATTYFVSGQTKYDNGLAINTGYNKQSVRANITQTIFNTITASVNLAYTGSTVRRGLNGNDNIGIIPVEVFSFTPSWFNLNAKTPNGGFVRNPFSSNDNPYQDAQRVQTPEEVNRTILGSTVNWKAFKSEHQSLELALVGGADFANVHDQFYVPPDEWVELGPNVSPGLRGVSNYGSSYARLSNYSVSLIHHLTPSSFLDATTSVGLTRSKDATYQASNTGTACVLGLVSFSKCAVQTPFYNQTEINAQGYYGQEQLLLFDQRLSLTGGVNAERNSANGGVNRYYAYPKLAGSFRFPNLAPGIDELKLRAAYGQSGTPPIYGLKFNGVDLATYQGIVGLSYSQAAGNPDIRPETNTDYESGFDLTAFHSRAALSATVYRKVVTNLLLQEAVSPSLGINTRFINGGQLSNEGIDISLNATPVQAGAFSWVTSENFARNYARVDKLPVPPFTAGAFFGNSPWGGYRIQQGADPNAIYGFRLDKQTGQAGRLEQIGNAAPAFTLGFGQDLSYGPLHAHIFFDWREGQTVSDLTTQGYDQHLALADTAASNRRNAAANLGLTPYAEHASFLKLRELSLKYDLPKVFVDKVGRGYVRYADISLSGRNLLTWTRYPGLDPEVSNFGSQQFGRGQDVNPYPPSRSYFISLDLGF